MRIYLKLSKNTGTIPFEHQHLLTGKIHNWIGINDIHDEISLYSFSQLQNGKKHNGGLHFQDGSVWFISSWDNNFIKQIIKSIQKNPVLIYGMEITELVLEETPDFTEITKFQIASPVFIKRNINGNNKFFYFDNKESSDYLKETLNHKIVKAGLPVDTDLTIRFDPNYHKPTTKMITYKGIKNRCSWCPLIIEGKPETKAFAWNVGVGNSTGIGFGAIK